MPLICCIYSHLRAVAATFFSPGKNFFALPICNGDFSHSFGNSLDLLLQSLEAESIVFEF
jgi:hypothetical protein